MNVLSLFFLLYFSVTTSWHSVSSDTHTPVLSFYVWAEGVVSVCTLTNSPLYSHCIARHLRDETSQARRCHRPTPQCVWRPRTQNCGSVHLPVECGCEHLLDCARHWGEGRRDYRGGVRHKECRIRRDLSHRACATLTDLVVAMVFTCIGRCIILLVNRDCNTS